jgi:hypothetical protein
MTELLQRAFAEATRLPEEEQDRLAKTLLEDLARLPSRTRAQFGSAKGLIRMADDFDESLQDFAEYME